MADEISIVVRAEDSFSSVLGNFGNIMTGIKSTIDLVVGAFRGVVDFGKQFTDEASASQDALANLDATLKSTSGAAGMSHDALVNLASSLQSVTKFSDETIVNGEAMLLTFTNIGSDVFPQATQAMLDMGAKFGSVDAAAIQLGKALNDPIAGISALSRIGVTFSEQQKTQIRGFMDMNDIASAQGVILAELTKEVGGVAEAMGTTFAGQLEILKNKLSDTKEGIGGLIIYGLQPLLDMIGPSSNFGKVWDILNTSLATVVDYLNKGVPPFQAFGLVIKNLSQDGFLASIAPMLKDIGDAFLTAQRALDGGGTTLQAIQAGLDKLSSSDGPLGKISAFLLDIANQFAPGGGGFMGALSVIGQSLVDVIITSITTTDWGGITDAMDKKLAVAISSHDWTSAGSSFGDAIANALSGGVQDGIDSEGSQAIPAIGRALSDWFLAAAGVADWEEFRTTFIGILKYVFTSTLASPWIYTMTHEWGVAIRDGLVAGINAIEINITDWFRVHIIDPVKSFLGIASPSTVFFQFGKDIIQGLINGITSMTSLILSGFTSLINSVLKLPGFKQIADFFGVTSSGTGSTGTFGNIGLPGSSSTGTTGGIDMTGDTHTRTGTDPMGTGTGGASTVNYNFYGPVYMSNVPAPGSYDCAPNPVIQSGNNQLTFSGY